MLQRFICPPLMMGQELLSSCWLATTASASDARGDERRRGLCRCRRRKLPAATALRPCDRFANSLIFATRWNVRRPCVRRWLRWIISVAEALIWFFCGEFCARRSEVYRLLSHRLSSTPPCCTVVVEIVWFTFADLRQRCREDAVWVERRHGNAERTISVIIADVLSASETTVAWTR